MLWWLILSLEPQDKVNCCSLPQRRCKQGFLFKKVFAPDSSWLSQETVCWCNWREWVGWETTDRKCEQIGCLSFFCCWWFALSSHILRILFLISAWLWGSQWNIVYRNDFWVEILRLFTVGINIYNEIKFTAGAQGGCSSSQCQGFFILTAVLTWFLNINTN